MFLTDVIAPPRRDRLPPLAARQARAAPDARRNRGFVVRSAPRYRVRPRILYSLHRGAYLRFDLPGEGRIVLQRILHRVAALTDFSGRRRANPTILTS